MAEVTRFIGIAFGFCQLPSHNPLPSNIHGDECGSPRPDLQPDLSEEWAHLQPASPAVDFHLWLCCKYERLKFVHDPKYLLRAGTAGRIDTDWRSRICPLYSVQVRDYSGTYTVKLIPCTTAQNMEYTVPPVCSPREPVTFDLDIRFQQVRHYFSFTLGSTIFLCCQTIFSLSLWLALSLLRYAILHDASLCRWATRLQWSSVWTLRCSCCPRGAYGSLMAPWVSVRRVM